MRSSSASCGGPLGGGAKTIRARALRSTSPSAADDFFSPASADCRADGGEAEDFVAGAVGVEDMRAELAEHFGDGAFAAGDAAEEAEDFHLHAAVL